MLNIDPNNRALHFSSKYPKVIRHTGIVCVYGTEFFQLKKKKLTHFQWMKSLTTQHFFLKYIPCFLHSLARQLFSFSVIHFTWCYFYMNTNSSQGGHDWHWGVKLLFGMPAFIWECQTTLLLFEFPPNVSWEGTSDSSRRDVDAVLGKLVCYTCRL